MWVAANRDARVFEDPGVFRLDRDPAQSLLYGAGIHACPGAPLARLELRIAIEEMLARSSGIFPARGKSPANAAYPAIGFATLPLEIR